MPSSKEYEQFLEEIRFQKYSFYERACNISEIIFPINPPNVDKFQKSIDFAHLNITPKGAFGFAILFTMLFTLFFITVGFLINAVANVPYLLLIGVFATTIFYYLYTMPFTLATAFRINASSEMVLGIVYMSIAMKVVPNIEYAVKFAATNLTGPLSRDLKKLLWDVYTGKFISINEALDPFMEKWKRENEEFVKAIFLIKSSFFETLEKRNKVLNEAINVCLTGTKERMKNYSKDLKAPLTVLNAIGILLPIIGLVFFPLMSVFLPNIIQPAFLVIGYNVILPIIIYYMMKTYLEKRPASFHQPNLQKIMKKKRFLIPIIITALAVPIILSSISYYQYYQATLRNIKFSDELLIYSMLVTWGISTGIILYTILSTFRVLKLRSEIIQIESELGEVLFQLGTQITRGMPIENAMKTAMPRIKELKMSKFIERILYNMESFGMTFSAAVFDEKNGAIKYYPSNLIQAVMKAVTEISEGGMSALSDAMLAISSYLRNMHEVEEGLGDLLEDVSATMNLQAFILAPLSSGIVVSMTAMIVRLLEVLNVQITKLNQSLGNYGTVGVAGNQILGSVFNLNNVISIYGFQLIVGVYMIEVVCMISIFTSIIKHGDESIMKRYQTGKTLAMATVIYTAVLLLVYFTFSSIIPAGVFA